MSDLNTTTEFSDTSVTNTEDTTFTSPNSQESNFMSEEEALSYLDSFNEQEGLQEQEIVQEDTNQTQMEVTGDELSIPDVDIEDFNITNVEPSNAQVEQNQTFSNQELLLAQILQKLDSKEQGQQNNPIEDENLPMLNELATRLKTAGLLPNGLSNEDKELLSEVKAIKEEIEQQKHFEQQKMEFSNKINQVDSFNKELEKSIPNYNTQFMVSLVKKISDQNPKAGEQILNNPSILISLWNKYGQVAMPQKPKNSAILNSSSKPNNITNANALFDKVKSGTASEEEELRLISML